MYTYVYVCMVTSSDFISSFFPLPLFLPSHQDRASILSIHTSEWVPPLQPSFISQLADLTIGYCGADLKSLCTETALSALRRKYPQIYETSDKLLIDVSQISMIAADFYISMKSIVPTAQRCETLPAHALPGHVIPLLLRPLQVNMVGIDWIHCVLFITIQYTFKMKNKFQTVYNLL